MTVRYLLWPLCVSLILLEAAPVSAQRRSFDRFRRSRPSQSPRNPETGERANPNHERAKSNAEQAHQRGDFKRAVDLTSNVLAENGRDHVAYYIRAGARVDLGMQTGDGQMVRDGIADARQAISLKRTNNSMYYLPYLYGMSRLTELEGKKEHAEVAVQVAGQVIELPALAARDKANLYYQRAFAYGKLEDHQAAIADFESALESEPKHLGALLGRATAHAAAGDPKAAIESFDKAVDVLPNDPLVRNNRGMFRDQIGDLQGAVDDFTKAVALNDRYIGAYTNRGFARMRMGQPAAAENDFSLSLQRFSEQPRVYVFRGSARLAQGKSDSARRDFNRALELDPNSVEAHSKLGFALYFMNDFAGARSSLEKASSLNPQMRHLNPWRYMTLVRLDEQAAADRLVAEQTAEAESEGEWSDRLLAFVSGSIDGEALLQSVEAADPELSRSQACEAHFFIAQRHAIDGNSDLAEQHYRQALETKSFHLSAFRGAQFALEQFTPDTDQARLAPGN